MARNFDIVDFVVKAVALFEDLDTDTTDLTEREALVRAEFPRGGFSLRNVIDNIRWYCVRYCPDPDHYYRRVVHKMLGSGKFRTEPAIDPDCKIEPINDNPNYGFQLWHRGKWCSADDFMIFLGPKRRRHDQRKLPSKAEIIAAYKEALAQGHTNRDTQTKYVYENVGHFPVAWISDLRQKAGVPGHPGRKPRDSRDS